MAKVTFDTDLCKGCGLCVTACPKGIVKLAADKINKNLEVTEEELARFTDEEKAGMQALVDERRADIKELYAVAEKINL
jgi:ferredoxin